MIDNKDNSKNNNDILISEKIVLKLLNNYYHSGCVIYMDSWYSSPHLFLKLLSLGFGATGMVKRNRKDMPKDEIPNNSFYSTNKLQLFAGSKEQYVNLVIWKDKKNIEVLNNFALCKCFFQTRNQNRLFWFYAWSRFSEL